MPSAGARAYNGGLGAEPPAGSRIRDPGHGVLGAKPPDAENLLSLERSKEGQICPILGIA